MVDSAVSPPAVGYPAPITNDIASTHGRNLQYLIGEPIYSTVNSTDLFEGALRVTHPLGTEVPAGMASVDLFDTDCLNEKSNTGLAVYLVDTGSNAGAGADWLYDIAFDQALINDNVGDFFTLTDGDSVGEASFCTRVILNGTTSNGVIPMFFRETNFVAAFNLTNRDFSLSDVVIEEAGTVSNNFTDPGPAFFITSCLCDDDFECIDPTTPIEQNKPFVFCIEPGHPNDSVNVHISNFNLNIEAGDITYSPVWYGVDGWESNAVTLVQESGKIVRTSSLLIQDFYIEGYETVDVSGNAFLEFDMLARGMAARNFYAFDFLVNLDIPNESRIGCLAQMIKDWVGFF